MSYEINVMYSSLFDAVFADSFFFPMRTVYVVSDSQLEEIKRNKREEELENIETSRKRLEESYSVEVGVSYLFFLFLAVIPLGINLVASQIKST